MKRAKALSLAQNLVFELIPFCERIQIAGSLRRSKPEVKDIEILAIPRPADRIVERDLFGEIIAESFHCHLEKELARRLADDSWPWRKDFRSPRWGKRYKRLRHERGICCDLYLTDPQRWGYQLAIRTGPAKFSHAIVTIGLRRGWHFTDSLLHQHPKRDGKVCPKGEDCPLILPTMEERDIFEALQLPWLKPDERTDDCLWEHEKERVFK